MINKLTYNQAVVTALTKREIEVMHLVSMGYSNEDMCKILTISRSTVNTHYQNVLSKVFVDWTKKEKSKSAMRLRVGLIWQKFKNEIVEDSKRKGLIW